MNDGAHVPISEKTNVVVLSADGSRFIARSRCPKAGRIIFRTSRLYVFNITGGSIDNRGRLLDAAPIQGSVIDVKICSDANESLGRLSNSGLKLVL
jgi:hypothetical protein